MPRLPGDEAEAGAASGGEAAGGRDSPGSERQGQRARGLYLPQPGLPETRDQVKGPGTGLRGPDPRGGLRGADCPDAIMINPITRSKMLRCFCSLSKK